MKIKRGNKEIAKQDYFIWQANAIKETEVQLLEQAFRIDFFKLCAKLAKYPQYSMQWVEWNF